MRQKRGFALVTVIFSMLIFSALAVGFVYLLFTESYLAVNDYRQSRAFYLAEAGRSIALKKLAAQNDWSALTGFPLTRSLAGGSFTVTVTNAATSRVTLISEGVVVFGGRTYRSRSSSTVVRSGVGGGIGDFAFYAFGDGMVTNLGSNITINGDIFINADLVLGTNVTINGDASATGSISSGSGSVITGESYSSVEPPTTVPSLETTFYDNQLAIAATYPVANKTYSGTQTISGVTYVHGNVSINNNVVINLTGTATIVATGTVSVANNVRIGNNFHLIAGGAVSINNNIDIGGYGRWYSSVGFNINNNAEVGDVAIGSGTVFLTPGYFNIANNCEFSGFVYAGGTVSVGNNADITGNIVAGKIAVVGNNSVITLNSGLVNYGDIAGFSGGTLAGSAVRTTGWTEVY